MIMVGDVLADRGLSDFCSLNVLAQMDKLGVKYDVLLGNHDLAAFGQCQSSYRRIPRMLTRHLLHRRPRLPGHQNR